MPVVTEDFMDRAVPFAQHLRRMQAGLVDEPAAKRVAILSAEIDHATDGLPLDSRSAFVEAVMSEFHSGGHTGGGGPGDVGAVGADGGIELKPAVDPVRLAGQIAGSWGTLGEPERAKVLEQLKAVLQSAHKPTDRDAIVKDVAEYLKLSPELVHPQRVGELCANLLRLSQAVLAIWQAVDRYKAEFGRICKLDVTATQINDAAARFLQRGEVSVKERLALTEEAKTLGRATYHLQTSMSFAVTKFADMYSREFSPKTIEKLAETKTGFGRSVVATCWEIYKEKANLLELEMIKSQLFSLQIENTIAKFSGEK